MRGLLAVIALLAGASSLQFEKWQPARRDMSRAHEHEWKIVGPANEHARIHLQIGLKRNARAVAQLEKRTLETANPGHQRYRQHLSPASMKLALEPSSRSIEAVTAWLDGAGINSTRKMDWIDVDGLSIAQAQQLLNTTFYTFRHPQSGQRVMRAKSYALPSDASQHIDTISPTTFLPPPPKDSTPRRLSVRTPRRSISKRDDHSLSACGNGTVVTLDCIRQVYSFDDYVPSLKNASLGVVAYSLNYTDLNRFLELYNPPAAAANARPTELDFYVQANETSLNDLETNLDVSTTVGLAWPVPVTLYRFGDYQLFLGTSDVEKDHYLEFLRQLTTNDTIPSVITTSFGRNEGNYPEDYARRICDLFMQITARGVTVIFSSGDNGAGGASSRYETKAFDATFPGSCPWITSVGATANPLHEVAATQPNARFASGGGFSALFPRPTWQDADIPSYIKNSVNASYANLTGFNPNGRGFPDVSALGWNGPLVVKGEVAYGAGQGTSMAAPIFASIVALLNDAEANAGRPPLGFLNPWLYGAGRQGLRDITEGEPNYANGNPYTPGFQVGYNVTQGWDAVTGLGVPDFKKLKDLLQVQSYSK